MRLAIDQAKLSQSEDHTPRPKVGAVIADSRGNVIAAAHRGERGKGDHAEFIVLTKASDMGFDPKEGVLFTTLEPCVTRGTGKVPCLERILSSGVPDVWFGMLDPNPGIRGLGERGLRKQIRVERFPHELIMELEELNREFVDLHKSSVLPNESVYVRKKIPEYVAESLRAEGLSVHELPDRWDVTAEDLAQYCEPLPSSYARSAIWGAITRARGNAYDKKYSDYSYSEDARGLNDFWQQEVTELLESLRFPDYRGQRVIDVGIGNGLEAEGLLEQIEQLTIVDIAPESLRSAQRRLPQAKAILAPAEALDEIESGSQDLYLSLRTFQSTYFGISRAVREACRVIVPSGLMVISVSNGFLGHGGSLIPGLIVPGSRVVDKNRPFVVAEEIRRTMAALPLEEIGLRSGFAEIFVFARRTQ